MIMNSAENGKWYVHVEFIVLLTTLLGGFYLLDGKIERQGERTDRLYEMFVQVQKDTGDRFYDLLKGCQKNGV
jgi:hypothetical protein